MSTRVDSSLISGACVVGVSGLGVLGSVIRATTGAGEHGPGLLYNDWDAGDDAKEFRALVLSGAPAGMVVYEDGSFVVPAGVADGTYTVSYRLFVDGADLGLSSASITIGAGGTSFSGSILYDSVVVAGGFVSSVSLFSGTLTLTNGTMIGHFYGSVVPIPVETPRGRRFIVAADHRRYVIPRDRRTLTVPTET